LSEPEAQTGIVHDKQTSRRIAQGEGVRRKVRQSPAAPGGGGARTRPEPGGI
jgi:hypothetical protein